MRTRTWSFFIEQFICMSCSHGEAALIATIVQRGTDPDKFDSCGYVPQLEVRATAAETPPAAAESAA